MNLINKIWSKIILFFTFTIPIHMLYAQDCLPDGGVICNPLGNTAVDIPGFIRILLTNAIRIGFPVVALAIIYCGFLFVAARGNEEKITKAKDALVYTLIGAAILLGSWAIAQLIQST